METTNRNNLPQVKTEMTRTEALKHFLSQPSVKSQFENALGVEQMPSYLASIIDLWNSNESLQECKPAEVIKEVMKAAVLRLPVINGLGYAYIVAYNGLPKMQIGWRGYVQLAYRTGWYRVINADFVYEGEYKSKNKLTGEFDLTGERTSDKIIGCFAYFEAKAGISRTLYMTNEDIRIHAEKYSPSYKNKKSAWWTDFFKMGRKTVLRLLLSGWGFLSIEMIEADKEEDGDDLAGRVRETIKSQQGKKEMGFDDAIPGDNAGQQNQSGTEDLPPWES